MSARIAPDTIGTIAALAVDYRPPAPSTQREVAPVAEASGSQTGSTRTDKSASAASTEAAAKPAEKTPPPPPPPEQPGADYVRAVISGQLLPRPTSAQELFARVGTGWTPPESEYRLTERIA